MDTRYEGEKFLNRLYKDLHMSEEVMHTAISSDSKDEKVRKYFERLERVENMARDSKYNGMKHLKNLYYRKYVIKPENVPESYFELQKKIALERGQGYVEITEKTRKEMINTIVEEQKKSLDIWLDYLMSKDAMYPEWFKYYAFQGMLKLGSYDKEKGVFNKRTGSTTNIFVDLNHEVLALTYDNLCKVLEGNSVDDESLQKLIENGSFAKIYGYLIKKLDLKNKELLDNNDGIWVKYDRESKPDELVKTLQGKGTGWCTAGYETAKKQLEGGDFHVYYTRDKEGKFTQPRIAIRMEGSKIGEIRGIAEHQNMESEMEGILSNKLEEFPDKDEYLKKVHDMEMLTKIYKEYKERELTKEEIRFLYEIDDNILGFGYGKDPRIKEILDRRNFKKDLSWVFDCTEDEISSDRQDILDGKKIVYFHGSLYLDDVESIEGLSLPQNVRGGLSLSSLTSAEGLMLPQSIGRDLDLRSLESAEGLTLPQSIGRDLDLSGLISAESLTLPQSIGRDLDLRSLESAEGLTLPQNIRGNLDLSSLTNAEGLTLPQNVGESLYLSDLKSAEDLTLPQSVGGYLALSSLISAEGLTLPKELGGSLNLRSLESAEGLTLPQNIRGNLDLRGLISAESLTLSQSVGGYLDLSSLTNAESLTLPQSVDGYLDLSSLTNAESLTLPQSVGGYLDLSSLTNAESLTLPQSVGGYLDLKNLESAQKLVLPQRIEDGLYLGSLISAEDLVLPRSIGGHLDLDSLTSAEEVAFPYSIRGELYLENLRSVDGLIVPKGFTCGKIYSKYISMEDLINKSLEQTQLEESHKRMGFSNIYILALVTYISSLILTLFGFLLLK